MSESTNSPPESDPWFARRVCSGVRGKLVEMAKATKPEHAGCWFVRDWLGIDDAKLYKSFRSALTDYIGRCLEARFTHKEKTCSAESPSMDSRELAKTKSETS